MTRRFASLFLAMAGYGQTQPPAGEQDQALGAIREYALHYIQNLPDYSCRQVTERAHDPIPLVYAEPPFGDPGLVLGKEAPHTWRSTDVFEEVVAVTRRGEG